MKYCRSKYMCFPLASVVTFCLCTQRGLGFESRFYDLKNHAAECMEIDELTDNANKKMECDKQGRLVICDHVYRPEHLSFDEITNVLETESNKNLLLVFFANPYGVYGPSPPLELYAKAFKKKIRKMTPFLKNLGYKRVVLYTLDPHHMNPLNGYYILADQRY